MLGMSVASKTEGIWMVFKKNPGRVFASARRSGGGVSLAAQRQRVWGVVSLLAVLACASPTYARETVAGVILAPAATSAGLNVWIESALGVLVLVAAGLFVGALLWGVRLRSEVSHLGREVRRQVTEQKQLDEQLRQTQKMETLGQLAGGIAHDFRNQLTVIDGYAQVLSETLGDEDGSQEFLHEIHEAARRSKHLTAQLLAFSRQETSTEPEGLNFNNIIADMEVMLRRTIREDVDLQKNLASDLNEVFVDRSHLEHTFLNLATNARDAMPNGGTLVVATANVELGLDFVRDHNIPPGSYVMFTITDTGMGMNEATRLRIFEPFFTTKGLHKGTGLGLASVYGFIRQCGGCITVNSAMGRGTTFRLYLPQHMGDDQETHGDHAAMARTRGTETILVAEDDIAVRHFMVLALRSRGYTVLETANVHEAIAMGKKHGNSIHLLLSDVIMPVMHGPELARRLRRDCPSMRVLYVSGHTRASFEHHGVMEKDSQLLTKPFTLDVLANAVRTILDENG